MKVAVYIPDDIYQRAERLARHLKKSRGRLYSDALREYLARRSPDEVTDGMNKVVVQVRRGSDSFVAAASRRALERNEW